MDESPDQIEEHIRSTRRELESNLQELEHRVKDATDWRIQFERHPWAFLGAALAGGILLSAALGGHRRPVRWSARGESTRPAARAPSAASRVWTHIKEGLKQASDWQEV